MSISISIREYLLACDVLGWDPARAVPILQAEFLKGELDAGLADLLEKQKPTPLWYWASP
jgi:hypothetical protein